MTTTRPSIHWSCNTVKALRPVELLLKTGMVDPNAVTVNGTSPLSTAVNYSEIEMIRTLVAGGADVNSVLGIAANASAARIEKTEKDVLKIPTRSETCTFNGTTPSHPAIEFQQPFATTTNQGFPQITTIGDFTMDDTDGFNFMALLNTSTSLDLINNNNSTCLGGFSDFPDTSSKGVADRIPSTRGSEDHVGELASLSLALHSQLKTAERGRLDNPMDPQVTISRLQGYPVQSMLDSTQKLVHIADTLLAETSRNNPAPSTLNDYCVDAADNISSNSRQHSDHAPTTAATPNSWPMFTSCMAPTPKPHVSVILLLLSCHVSLVRLYAVFYGHLRHHLLYAPAPTHGRLFPHLELGSFQALMGRELETALVVQVTTHLLERLQRARADCAAVGLITPALMHAVQMQEEMDAMGGWGNESGDVSVLVRDVRRLLKQRSA
ncbi:hypothetical protein GTA08_BOTSDO14218 [Botryosphaeria dothidea]|uniref:Uncharacterized protein n=1 Tax=Botryosphaeria dothidea TaxID=55169 RepID=A0A8H4IRF7_9PEZI|nr:hypothetical protein GTA08_BOTSDO14218 [Botryosphaeria dothidea]